MGRIGAIVSAKRRNSSRDVSDGMLDGEVESEWMIGRTFCELGGPAARRSESVKM